ncbi:LuxR C-terminal-related transcriptional regulator [Gillisia sp. M10.2A]|uniref:LuxR C-terminal-related transcriptional regulator n=1 Tax=Gillisia lutea TaxID=2909668 RepID=A0ABS9EM04_9FLAO|nr:helix-turn-helix transcriptional regulator [Gillisia lutea]MCF4102513.1 LuxR C-terminal-related transcriptional regulator [Gillisia lutea]
MILLSYMYVNLISEPISPEILEQIKKKNNSDFYQIEKNRMQILFMKERGWNFIVLACLALSLGIWITLSNQGKRRINFMGYKYRIEKRFANSDMEVLNFQNRLKEKFDSLTSNDLLIAEMLFDGLSTKEISSELNISSASANTARYRLRKKMKLSSKTDLIEFLQRF